MGRAIPPEAEAHFVERARRYAESLELGIAGAHGVLLGRGDRFHNDNLNVQAPSRQAVK